MLAGVMLATNAFTSAIVVGPAIPEAELAVVQLDSAADGVTLQVNPLTAAYLVASFAALLRW
jgi:hypothetical protein